MRAPPRLEPARERVLISDNVLIEWFLLCQLPHKTVHVSLTNTNSKQSKEQVDGFVGELTSEKPFDEYIVWDRFFIANQLVRIHFIAVMIRWTGLAPWSSKSLSQEARDSPG